MSAEKLKPAFENIFLPLLIPLSIGGHGRTPWGVEVGGGEVKIDFRKTSFLSVSRRNFFLKFQCGSPRVKKGV